MANSRFVNNSLPNLQQTNRSSIIDCKDLSVLTLEEAVQTIIPLLSDVTTYVETAKERYNSHSTLLTRDESLAIYLYTMPTQFYFKLNTTLRAENRQLLKPWLAFLKLFISALEKLPSTKATLWRGVDYDATSKFIDNDVYTWWDITSWSMNINIVQPFLGESGTLFTIEAVHGKDVSMFSAISDEQEVILMPGTRMQEMCPQSRPQSELNDLFEQIKEEYKQNSRIERFMNPSISYPIEQSYINLSIVETKEQREKEKKLRDAQDPIAIMGTFEEIYGTKASIDVKDIFKTCKNDKKQVLVFGRAGIGKSTFCRYVTYQWATGSYWSHYELLALIPLRHLTTHRYPRDKSYSLIDIVKKEEVFLLGLTGKEEELLKKQFDPKKTLWILDGYDEVVQNIPPHLKPLLEQLLKTPHHIITSRPYLNALSYDVQMEITGFTDDNIENYVKNFFDQMQDELHDASLKNGKLLSFLRSNESIWGVAHIPVNLELICSLWSNEDCLETEQLTITKLYTMMIEWLCRRYLRTEHNEFLQLSQQELDQRCQQELLFLESLAFNAMESNTILIRPTLLEKAWSEAKISSQQHPHILNIGILKSFHQQGIGHRIQMNKDHHFVHLSFQEYFAARYLINALRRYETGKAIDFIKYQKYNQRYILVFTFAAGLLSNRDEKASAILFWNAILGQPLDLIGIRHLQLVISCVEETSDKLTFPRRSELLEWISQCLKYSFTVDGETIRQHFTRSLQRAQSVTCNQTIINVLIDLLQHDDINRKVEVLQFISELQISNPSITLIRLLITRLNDEHEHIRAIACSALGNIGEKAATTEVITKLVSTLGDQSHFVRDRACEAVGNIGKKAAGNEMITTLVSALGDQSEYVRRYACKALGKMGEKAATNEVIAKLVSAVGDKSGRVRMCACEALGKMAEKAVTNEVITKLASALGDQSEDVRRYVSSALGNMGEKAAIDDVITKLMCALGDPSKDVRWNACKALEKMGEKVAISEVINKLVSALGDQSIKVRQYACESLGNMGEKATTNEVITKLVRALEEQSEDVRRSACEALGKMSEKAATSEVITKLVSALGDQSADVRRSACEALGKMGEKAATSEVITKLASALGGQSEDVRKYACKAFGNIGEKAATHEVIAKLVSAVEDQTVCIRRCARLLLRMMGQEATTNELIAKLVSARGDQSEDVNWDACEALGNIHEQAATNDVITKLVSALGDQSVRVRRYACAALLKMDEKAVRKEVITMLVRASEDQSEDVRGYACEALGNMGEMAATNEVITKLVSALEDESEHVRRYACEALKKMGEKAATNEVITKLVNALDDQREYVRRYACEGLGNMGEKAATNEVITSLVRALEDKSGRVRMYACKALGKMGEKVATNEVIAKLASVEKDNSYTCLYEAWCAIRNILSSSAVMAQLDQRIVADICLHRDASNYLGNALGDDLVKIFLNTENPDWVCLVNRFAFLEGLAVTVTEDKVVVYGMKEPFELLISSARFREELTNVLTNQSQRLHLYFEIPPQT